MDNKTVLVTGAYGFIGPYITDTFRNYGYNIITLDSLTYAAINFKKEDAVPTFSKNTYIYKNEHIFVNKDINDNLDGIFVDKKIDLIVHAAAESHVDNSILDPGVFAKTNILGTLNLLNYAVKYNCKFLYVSTDEVTGSWSSGEALTENSPLKPSSPYSASKASAELLVKSFGTTFGLKYMITRGSNTFGFGQHPEKFIPKLINCTIDGKPFPLYGTGNNIRQWISAKEHARGICYIANTLMEDKPTLGETVFNICSDFDLSNLEVISILANVSGESPIVQFVPDRKGHDKRYFISGSKAEKVGFKSTTTEKGFKEFIKELYLYEKNNRKS